jgi:hypothetical protein
VVARFPSAFNFPVGVTAENRPLLEALTLDMIAWLKMEMVCLFDLDSVVHHRSGAPGPGQPISLAAAGLPC